MRQEHRLACRPDPVTGRRPKGLFSYRVISVALAPFVLFLALFGGAAASEAKRRILHVDSYHSGNEWNDRIAAALKDTLESKGVEVRIVHLDAKRRGSEEQKAAASLEAKRMIEGYGPDLVTMSDDDAAKYLLMPHFRNAEIPVVFCGLNWDASVYGLPYRNTTGMVEVSPIPQIVQFLRHHARGKRIGFLAEDTETKRKEMRHHERVFDLRYDQTYFVTSFSAWKDAFRRAQDEVDMLLILGVGALKDWDIGAAAAFAEEVTAIPTGTDFDWLMPVSLVGVVKSPEEQGRWAAQAALRILDGIRPDQIPLTHNRDGELVFNSRIARRLGIESPPPLARIVP